MKKQQSAAIRIGASLSAVSAIPFIMCMCMSGDMRYHNHYLRLMETEGGRESFFYLFAGVTISAIMVFCSFMFGRKDGRADT